MYEIQRPFIIGLSGQCLGYKPRKLPVNCREVLQPTGLTIAVVCFTFY